MGNSPGSMMDTCGTENDQNERVIDCGVCECDEKMAVQFKQPEGEVSLLDSSWGTPIYQICQSMRSFDHHTLHSLILEDRELITATDGEGKTALFYAVQYRNYGAAEFLVKHGMDVDHRARDGRTACAHAAEIPDAEMLKLLFRLRKKYAHLKGSGGTKHSKGLDNSDFQRAPTKGRSKISPALVGNNKDSIEANRFFSEIDKTVRQEFRHFRQQELNQSRIDHVTAKSRVQVVERQAAYNKQARKAYNIGIKQSWTDPDTHMYMMVKSGTQGSKPQDCLTRRAPWGGVVHMDEHERESIMVGAMSVTTRAERALGYLSTANKLESGTPPHLVLRDEVGLSNSHKAREVTDIIPYNKRADWKGKGLPMSPGIYQPGTELTTGARRFAPM
mmetsp:Transcript_33180/g.51668  ORF Transcript_33180/g.51668 Transcript_33180/m.51668 type:complete len:389 (-) Transcript_33180:126-1292(-)